MNRISFVDLSERGRRIADRSRTFERVEMAVVVAVESAVVEPVAVVLRD